MLVEILHRLIDAYEYRRVAVSILALAMMVCTLAWSAPAAAQDELPQIMPSEHKLPTKKDLGPRAVGILQLSDKGKASLVPIAIMIDGRFWDASAYKADPVPMALEYGTIYEAERTGSSEGLFTIGSALHANAVNAPTPWLGTGSWVPAGTEKKSTTTATAIVPLGMTDTDAPPRLTRDATKVYPQKQPTNSSSTSSSKSTGSSSDEPPRLSKPASESSPSPDSTSPDAKPPQSAAPSAPSSSGTTGSKSGSGKATENIPKDDSGADAANRPVLRRGKPTVSFADEEIPGYSRPGGAPSAKTASATSTKEAESTPGPVQVMAAVSDAHGPEPHSYGFEWLKGEEEQRHDQMLAFAKQQLAAYLKTQSKEQVTPEEHPSRSLHRVTAKSAPEPVFQNAKMIAYDLWLTNQPILVFTAEAHLPPSASGAQAGPYRDLTYSITIAAYPDIYNNLHKLYVGVTDKYHLDVTPKLELIDAIDADGDGRGELLFRETSDAGTGWVIYRATADSLWKMYDSLNPQ